MLKELQTKDEQRVEELKTWKSQVKTLGRHFKRELTREQKRERKSKKVLESL